MQKKIKIINVVGARPNFMKIAPFQRELDKHKNVLDFLLVHTGQHYDANMSDTFFKDLDIRKPDYFLGCGGGLHGEQTGKIMIEFEKVLLKEKPDLVVVAGDVNSTIACSLDAVKLNIKVAHIEAGCRSFDRNMPEEINRILTDAISDFLFALDEISVSNLHNEGISDSKIFFTGDIMLDSLVFALSKVSDNDELLTKYNLTENNYAVLTLHRPSNVDSRENLMKIFSALNKIQENIPVIFPVHPRTLKNINNYEGLSNYINNFKNLIICEPLGYFDFVNLFSKSKFVITDSGSLQQETTFLNIPCITLRENTERPLTIEKGTNVLAGSCENKILDYFKIIMNNNFKVKQDIKFWDGKTSQRIVKIILDKMLKSQV